MSDIYDLIMVAYQSAEVGRRDFDALVKLVKDKTVDSDGVILVDHDDAGNPRVVDTGDHLGRKEMGWGGGVGLLVGLFSPPLLASIVVGGAVGGLIGKFTKHKIETGIEAGMADRLAPGMAMIIAIVDDDDRLTAEQALGGSPAKSLVQTDKARLSELKADIATAALKFCPDRTVLPIPDKTFAGVMGRTLKDSVADWSMIPGPKAPDGAPNVLSSSLTTPASAHRRHSAVRSRRRASLGCSRWVSPTAVSTLRRCARRRGLRC